MGNHRLSQPPSRTARFLAAASCIAKATQAGGLEDSPLSGVSFTDAAMPHDTCAIRRTYMTIYDP
jgi:hypothetical protein